jgi:hypothetical protein
MLNKGSYRDRWNAARGVKRSWWINLTLDTHEPQQTVAVGSHLI